MPVCAYLYTCPETIIKVRRLPCCSLHHPCQALVSCAHHVSNSRMTSIRVVVGCRQNMGDFLEVMSGVSDASMFIDAANAAGIGLGGFSGTLVIPLNDVSTLMHSSWCLALHRLAGRADNFSHSHDVSIHTNTCVNVRSQSVRCPQSCSVPL